MTVAWVFDPAPPSGKRTAGSSAEYSFTGQIDTLVRETVQNSLDARISAENPVSVRFRVVDLTGAHLKRFLKALDWNGLQDNLSAAPAGRGGRAIAAATKRVTDNETIRLLIIEDRGTRGLEGSELRISDTDPNPFCALVRDELYSDKSEESAQGSFGLGKSVLWAFSGLKTVLFFSEPASPPEGRAGHRFIGRASLPWHRTNADGECSGDGWLGHAKDLSSPNRHADSVWGKAAAETARECHCERNTGEPGLSIVVVGFSEPGEEDPSAKDLADQISAASMESFWPALVKGDLRIEIITEANDQVTGQLRVDPEQADGYRELGELLHSFTAGGLSEKQKLEPGQSAIAWIDLEVSARTLDVAHPECKARAAVLVRLLGEDEAYPDVSDRIFRFRGPGMIIRAESRNNLSLAARPYLAAVLAGLACGEAENQHRAEAFLRAAEPPAHDRWVANTRKLKQEYVVHGCKAKLDRFDGLIRTTITRLISKPQEAGGQLPKAILRYLRFAGSGGGGSQRFVSITKQTAKTVDQGWHFTARCRRLHDEIKPWYLRVRLKYARDGGGGDDLKAIGRIEAEGATRVSVVNGVGIVELPGDVSSTRIAGWTDPDALPHIGVRAAMALSIDGSLGEP